MEIEWDPKKAASNLKKHGVSFDEAATVLLDPNGLAQPDTTSSSEERYLLLGMSSNARLVTLIYTLRGEDRARLISARKATRKEARNYA